MVRAVAHVGCSFANGQALAVLNDAYVLQYYYELPRRLRTCHAAFAVELRRRLERRFAALRDRRGRGGARA